MRMFNFQKEPKLSYLSMNKIIEWFSKKNYFVFTKYVEAHIEKIINSKLISKEVLMDLMQKIENRNEMVKEPEENTEIQLKNNTVVEEKNTIESNSINSKQTNVLSSKNTSIIHVIKGKVRQLNFLSYGNKQEVSTVNNHTNK